MRFHRAHATNSPVQLQPICLFHLLIARVHVIFTPHACTHDYRYSSKLSFLVTGICLYIRLRNNPMETIRWTANYLRNEINRISSDFYPSIHSIRRRKSCLLLSKIFYIHLHYLHSLIQFQKKETSSISK